jgi:hypothetical protein
MIQIIPNWHPIFVHFCRAAHDGGHAIHPGGGPCAHIIGQAVFDRRAIQPATGSRIVVRNRCRRRVRIAKPSRLMTCSLHPWLIIAIGHLSRRCSGGRSRCGKPGGYGGLARLRSL